MKLPSLQTLWQGTGKVAKRFPLQFILAIVSTAIWWYLIDVEYTKAQLSNQLAKLLVINNLALTLLLAADLFCEVNCYSGIKKWMFSIISLLICTGLYFALNPWIYEADLFRIFLLAFAFHLLVAFAPFVGKSNLNGFWQYNKTLFLRFLTSAFYAAVLYAGLAIALFAIDGLFNVTINFYAYIKLFALVSAGFTTVFFLAGIPDNFLALAEDLTYPKGLKIFTQYVLIPLMTIYLGILLVYEIKIIIFWSLPKGIVSALILGYAVFGILSLLLIYPIKDKDGNGWIRLFSKFFYLMMIPLVVLLLLAIGKRVGNYGITESRYVLIVLALWLSGITIYFLLSKKQNIKMIPISLCILAILATYGPQSAFSVAKFSQITRLENLMKSKDKKEVGEQAAVVRYLVSNHGLSALQSFTKTDLQVLESKINERAKKENISEYEIKNQKIDTAFTLLKVKDGDYNYYSHEQIRFVNQNRGMINISGYDVMFSINDYTTDSLKQFDGTTFKAEEVLETTGAKSNKKLKVTIGKEVPFIFSIKEMAKNAYHQYKANQLIKEDYEAYLYPSEKMLLTHETKRYIITMVVSNMNGSYDRDLKDFEWFNFDGYLLIKKKNKS